MKLLFGVCSCLIIATVSAGYSSSQDSDPTSQRLFKLVPVNPSNSQNQIEFGEPVQSRLVKFFTKTYTEVPDQQQQQEPAQHAAQQEEPPRLVQLIPQQEEPSQLVQLIPQQQEQQQPNDGQSFLVQLVQQESNNAPQQKSEEPLVQLVPESNEQQAQSLQQEEYPPQAPPQPSIDQPTADPLSQEMVHLVEQVLSTHSAVNVHDSVPADEPGY